MQPIHLSFDLPVSTNRMYANNRGGGVRLTYAARVFKEKTQIAAKQQYPYNEPLKGEICVSIKFFGLRLDIDNALKVTLDSLIGICFEDDKQVMELHCYIVSRTSKRRCMEIEMKLIGEDVK